MAKIFNVRLPDAGAQYSAQQFDQLVRSLEQIVLALNTTYGSTTDQNQAGAVSWFGAGGGGAGGGFAGSLRGFQLSNGILLPHGMLMSVQDQANPSITGENAVTYNSTPVTNGVRIVDNSKIYVPCSGNYLVTFSLMVTNRGNTAAEFEVWAKDTGSNIALSNTRFDIPVRKSSGVWSHVVAVVSGIFTVTDPSVNYLQLFWCSDSLDVYLEHYAAGTNPTRPEIPSVILTINFVSAH